MNKIDISLKLIHCQSGMQLDCTIADNVIFNKVIEYNQIECLIGESKDRIILDKYGQLRNIPCPKCIIFPKDQRDWSKFNIEQKFDINTLKPFDKVLVRDNNDKKWRCNFYSGYMEGHKCPFTCVFHVYVQCIPYNEETKHLVGIDEMPPKKYITWEE